VGAWAGFPLGQSSSASLVFMAESSSGGSDAGSGVSAELDHNVAALESDLGLSEGFYGRLLQEDDWSFVVKLHALLEAAMTSLLTAHFRDARLQDLLARMEVGSRAATGKLSFASALGVLSQRDRRFVTALADLKSELTSSLGRTKFSFTAYVTALDGDGRRKFLDAFAHGLGARVAREDNPADRKAVVLEHAKLAIWSTAMSCFGSMYMRTKADRRRADNQSASMEQHVAEFEQALSRLPTK